MSKLGVIIVTLVIVIGLTGLIYMFTLPEDEKDAPPPAPYDPFEFHAPAPNGTYYHFDGGLDASEHWMNLSANLTGANLPYWANGTYYGIGVHTFEPTIGVTSTGTLFMTSHNSAPVGTKIWRSQDQGQSWEDVTPSPNAPNSNDPYLYVDPWTDRLVKFDMHALLGMTVEISDDEGETWEFFERSLASGYTPQDHQTIASTPYDFPGSLYPTTYVFSINTGLQGGGVGGSYGCTSLDGGQTWDAEKPHYEIGQSPASGLSGHLVGSENGYIYRGQPAGNYDPAMYRSTDGGLTWTEHIITTNTGSATHEIAISTDEGDNVHAFWIGSDNMPYYSNSQDFGESWRDPMMVAPPGVNGTGFPTIAGGADGRAAWAYIGLNPEGTGWSGYLGVVTDAFVDVPLITTVTVNDADDPLDVTSDCGYRRCGGFGDFIDICIDPDGRPWAALANNMYLNEGGDGAGIVGTYTHGPALRGDLDSLPELPIGGPTTI